MRRATFNKTTRISLLHFTLDPSSSPVSSIANDALVVVTESHKITSTRDEPIDPDPRNEREDDPREHPRIVFFFANLFSDREPSSPSLYIHAHTFKPSLYVFRSIYSNLEYIYRAREIVAVSIDRWKEKDSRHDAMIRCGNLSGGGAQLGK